PGIALSANNLSQSVCAPGSLAPITIDVGSSGGFTGSTALSFPSLPAGFSGAFSATPVTPTAQSIATVTLDASAVYNTYPVEILATPTGANSQSILANVNVFSLISPAPPLQNPADGAVNVSEFTPFNWSPTYQAASYTLKVDDDPLFQSIDLTFTGSGTSHIATSPLQPSTTYYWHVTASNACGEAQTPVRSFTTTSAQFFCSNPGLPLTSSASVPDNIVIGQGGTLDSINVNLNITHTWVGDIRTTLTHVDTGTSVLLMDRPGVPPAGGGFGCSGDDINATLSDSAVTAVENQCAQTSPAIMGTLTPNNALSAFSGETLSGTWTLLAEDMAGGDSGTFNQWCIVPSQVPEPGSVLLLASGLLFMCGEQSLRRRRRRNPRQPH
ncbi:MAG TPA: PEP-CTERM sorting domain-containing protein, partial [Myxococcales bacterium]|nr:PEP-CTERM sorting domain-containing protein [Myxococcales bacterium]